MKHLNDMFNEGILDTEENIKNLDNKTKSTLAVQWVLDHICEYAAANADLVKKALTVNKDNTLTIDMPVDLVIKEDMPDYVQFNDVYNIEYKIQNKTESSIKINIPVTTAFIKVVTYQDRSKPLELIMESKKGCTVPDVEIKGHIESIKFPRKFNCENLNMMSLDTFKFESSRLPSCKTINLSREAVENYIRKQWKIEADRIKLWN
jgi:hypothetical protein